MKSLWKACLPLAAVALVGAAAFEPPRVPDAEALCGGNRYVLKTVANGASPYVALTAGGATGLFLLDYGATKSSLSAQAFSEPEGSVRDAQVSLPGVGAAPFVLRGYGMPLQPAGGQLGVVGTDLLSLLSVQFTGPAVFIGAAPCQQAALRGRGLSPIAQAGYFGADPALNDNHHPNVPVVYVSIGDVRAWAQLDTGYDDVVYTHTVDINRPLFDRLSASGARLERIAEVTVATCDGRERRSVYKVDRPLAVETKEAAPIARIDAYHLIVKPANTCGGIGAMSEPAAQLGASFLKDFGTIVFDPGSKTVWLAGGAKQR